MNYRIKKGRLLFVAFVFFAAFAILAARLLQYQVIDAAVIVAQSNKKVERKIVLPAKRGTITDREGNVFAYSLENSTVYFDKTKSENIDQELDALFEAYPDINITQIREKINNSEEDLVAIIDNLPRVYLRLVKRLGTEAIVVNTIEKRVYPNNNLASHIIGFTNIDGVGLSGLEYTQENFLRGVDGYIETKTDARGRKLAHSDSNLVEPINGYTVVTTIDQTIQYYLEDAIEVGCQASGAKKVMAVLQDTKTGDILGMASYPDFDPNDYRKPVCDIQIQEFENMTEDQTAIDIMQKYWTNPVTQQLYEPGSTFKTFIGLVGLEEGKSAVNSGYYCEGSKVVTGKTIKCWKHSGHGQQNLTQAFQNSCNVAFMDIVAAIGKDTLYNYITAFRLNKRLDIPLNGEAKPILTPIDNLYPVDLARLGFGHNISLTPLHMLNVFNVVANQGTLIQPRLIKEIKDENGNVIESYRPRDMGRVVSQKTADTVLEILETVVTDGSGKRAYIPGYRIGGKTGTSIKIIDGRYDDDRKVFASFAAIAPIDDPRFILIVIVDEPQTDSIEGSTVAAPIAKEIMTNVFAYLKIEPVDRGDVQMTTVPNLIGSSFAQAQAIAGQSQVHLVLPEGLTADSIDPNRIVDKQYPLSGTLVIQNDKVFIRFEE